MKFPKLIIFAALALTNFCSANQTYTVSVNHSSIEIKHAFKSVNEKLQEHGIRLSTADTNQPDIILRNQNHPLANSNDGYSISNAGDNITIEAENGRGSLYGLLDLAEQLKTRPDLAQIESRSIKAHHPFRAIKFNLPWYSYRAGEHLELHTETCQDLAYWESFLDMMLENRFNTLTLWNLHPFIYMVKSLIFGETSTFTDDELAEWQSFWKSLFLMAKERGIETYVVNWNMFVSQKFAEQHGGLNQKGSKDFWGHGETSPEIEQYTRELVTQTIDTYPNLTGLGITLGERMGGMTSPERRDWIDRTIIAGMKNAKREARLIYRAPLSAGTDSSGSTSVTTEQLTRDAIENIGMNDPVWVEFKFNWSHAHTSPKLSIVHGGMLTDTYWEPLSDKYKAVWTMRNEDFFVLRWAQPDFIREFIKLNSQPYVGGVIVGSECYIPAKDYITQEKYRNWNYAYERQWLFYKTWGRLLFDPATEDSYFESALEDRFPKASGAALLQAWKLASMNANRLGSFYQGTWDGTLYSEGFGSLKGELIDIDELIYRPVLDPKYINISEFVDPETSASGRISPLLLAAEAESESDEALRIVASIKKTAKDQTLLIELNDIETWSWHGKYLAAKLRAGVALATYRHNGDEKQKQIAINELTDALAYWNTIVEHVERFNVAEMPYQFDANYSWRKQTPLAEQDIQTAQNAIQGQFPE